MVKVIAEATTNRAQKTSRDVSIECTESARLFTITLQIKIHLLNPKCHPRTPRKMKCRWYKKTRHPKRRLKKLGTIIEADEEGSTDCESIPIKTKGHDHEGDGVDTS
ncbi:uncharacterized protein J4E79_011141 [Alternaria viburni]|uniref:uncharacterized protein n=1 Tax=Alternaria viburni TaxID=566460 RepID=UPI0020C2981F|nr:uncharacterized protein J4E79_011141 [Alternaria viburni]KAI4644193.1 hypothetical protein J4E79_011141 [Alternaria viburni]